MRIEIKDKDFEDISDNFSTLKQTGHEHTLKRYSTRSTIILHFILLFHSPQIQVTW